MVSHASNRKLLILLNGGKMSRNYLLGIANSARRLGIDHLCVEIDQIRAAHRAESGGGDCSNSMRCSIASGSARCSSYTLNGCDLPGENACGNLPHLLRSSRHSAHLLFWTDHPQWANERQALQPGLAAGVSVGQLLSLREDRAHAQELNRILGWPNCFDCPLACDPDQIRPAEQDANPEFDVVAIYGGSPKLLDRLKPFLDSDDPDPRDIMLSYVDEIRAGLDALWKSDAPEALRPQLQALAEQAADRAA